jgi:signal transduction histidine kinase
MNMDVPAERSVHKIDRPSTSRGPPGAPLPLRAANGQAVGLDMAVDDITRREREADDVHRVADLLEERLIERTRDLERATKERQDTLSILHEVQKRETMGHLTGGIAHDFNNMLTVISGNIGMLDRRLRPEEAELRRLATNALKAVERAGALTQQLLVFARRQPLQAKAVDVNRLVLDMKDLLGRTLGETVIIETTLVEELWPALADENQLENALLNLAVNARDAMPDGGRLMMETANAVLDEDYAAMNAEVNAGDYVSIAVIDTGTGMTPEVVALAFEPFFTTKHLGEGTGLGLSQVYGFIKHSGGHVTIVSKPGAGTAVTLYLPRLTAAIEADPPEADIGEPALAGSSRETILVVEDDEGVRSSTVAILRDLGYRVFAASDGLSALRTLDREPAIDLLFTDIGLPGTLPGNVLAETASAKKPGLKVLLTSGYAWNGLGKPGQGIQGPDLLPKPSTYATLATKIRHVLDRGAAGGRPRQE